ncbi:MAG TPA: DUF998 domain-containing protein [Streptosporangiaceae bacterium]|nr:DUF998 domain-containing protein [Streptosporangiaceae bacterium]
MTAPAPAMARRAVTRRLPRAGLDGGALSVRAWLLLAAGTAGGLVFTGVYLAEGATRAGYRTLAQPISALSLGPGGWVQQLNFIVFGMLVCLSAAGWRAALAPGRGALAFPVLRVIAGVGLVMDGLFAQDPSGGYPLGARAGVPTVHGQVHTLFAVITITALAGGSFVLARRFAAEPGWRRWAVFAVAAGVATIVFIAAFAAAGGHGGLAGLWERAAGGATSVLTVAVLARLAVTSRPVARARRLGPAAGKVA